MSPGKQWPLKSPDRVAALSLTRLTIYNDFQSRLYLWCLQMNRKKKINQIFKARAKKSNAKTNPKAKDRYISKAERARLETDAAGESSLTQSALSD